VVSAQPAAHPQQAQSAALPLAQGHAMPPAQGYAMPHAQGHAMPPPGAPRSMKGLAIGLGAGMVAIAIDNRCR
jgi:hypothetical protein